MRPRKPRSSYRHQRYFQKATIGTAGIQICAKRKYERLDLLAWPRMEHACGHTSASTVAMMININSLFSWSQVIAKY
jgi:hypothetical protein